MRPKRILIADGATAILAQLAHQLMEAGYTVEQTRDSTAFWTAMTPPPDLILLDISTLYIDIIDAYSRLKSDPLTNHIPIFLITTGTMAQRALIAHMVVREVITKPVVMERFVEIVARHLCEPLDPMIDLSSR